MFTLFKRAAAQAAKRARAAQMRAAAKAFRALAAPPTKSKAAKPKVANPALAKPAVAKSPGAKPIAGKPKAATPAGLAPPKLPAKPRENLAATLRRIRAGGMPPTEIVARARTAAPRGAAFSVAVHESAHGRRSYKLYVPAAARTGARLPLVVMLHGCTQTPDDFARGTGMNALADEIGFFVAYPAQPSAANANKCWNWFKPLDQGRGAGEPALIAGIAARILAERNVDPGRVYIAGLSAGGTAAATVAAAYPDIFAAVGVHSAVPAGAARSAAAGFLAMRRGAPGEASPTPMPTIVFHGDADPVVHPRNGRYVARRALGGWPGLKATVRKGRAPGGGGYVRTTHRIGAGKPLCEHWAIERAAHAWSGGNASGSFADPSGPDASREMVRFFLRHRTTLARRRAVLSG